MIHPFRSSTHRLGLGLLALTFALVGGTSAARAQTATKIFVASYGSDANAGTSVLPKRSFQAAHDSVAAGGEIVVLDTAGYGALTISKSVSLVVPSGVNGFITVAENDGIDIEAAATDVVSLQGLIIEGGGTTGGSSGIFAPSVGTLRVQDCSIRNFDEGIYAYVDNITTHVLISGTSVRDTGSAGFDIESYDDGTADAIITACHVDTTGFVGVYAYSDETNTTVTLSESTITNNTNGNGIYVDTGGTVVADHNTVTGNNTGITNNETAFSYGNNTFADNGNNGTFTGTFTKQ